MNTYLRNAKKENMDDVVRVEEEAWSEEIRASREKFEKRLEIFPEGFFVIYKDNEIVGVSTSMKINYNPKYPPHSWEGVTDNGWIEKTHDPNGNAIYVVSVGVSPRGRGVGCGTALVKAQIDLVKKLNLEYLVLGARVPFYHKKEYDNIKIGDYLKLKDDNNKTLDPEIRFYEKSGLKVFKAMPDYMEDDPESRNYGVIMVWENKK